MSDVGESGRPPAGDLARGVAERLFEERRQRSALFGEGLFVDAGWDILLFLYMRADDFRRTPLSEVFAAASVSPAQGVRWVKLLIKQGLVELFSSETKKAQGVRLSERGERSMENYLVAL